MFALTVINNVLDISSDDFNAIRHLVYNAIGVNLTDAKKALVVSRLSKRVRDLNLDSFSRYIRHLEVNPAEAGVLFNCVTTNVTSFFREKHHFEYLENTYLPGLEAFYAKSEKATAKKLRVWSAGCSTGEEPYTLAMVLCNYFKNKKNWQIKILATDVNTEALHKGLKGIYSRKESEGIPYDCLKSYFKLGTGPNSGFFKANERLQALIDFRQLNLKGSGDYPLSDPCNIIFCRNVFIYFDKETRSRILRQFHRLLVPGGLLFLGHSESINTSSEESGRWRLLRHTIYQKQD